MIHPKSEARDVARQARETTDWPAVSASIVGHLRLWEVLQRHPVVLVYWPMPDEPDIISFEMPDVAHTFRSGHRLMIQIQSSWFPLVDRNPQTFVDIPHAEPEDFKPATQRVFRSAQRPSSVTLLVE